MATVVGEIAGSRGVTADLATAEGVAALVAAEPAADIVINNLGMFAASDFFSDEDDALWEQHWQVNVVSGLRVARAYLPGMAAKGWGRLIFISSDSAFFIKPELIHYCVSKTANVATARGLAKRMKGTGVTVNSVLPGPTFSRGMAEALEEARAASGKPLREFATELIRDTSPNVLIQRPVEAEEVASLVTFLASDDAAAITGSAMRVDGGVTDTL